MDWRVLYIIEKLLKRKCLKWAHMTHLDIWNTSYGQNKGRESNWQFDSPSLKVRNPSNFLAYKCRATYCWKVLNMGYNFALDFILIGGLHTKLWGPKVARVPILEFRDSHLGVSGKNVIWMWASWKGIEYIIKGRWWLPSSLGHGESCESKFACDSS